MPAAASTKRTTPARKKAKLVAAQIDASTPDLLETPTPPIVADDDNDDDDFVPSTPSKGKVKPKSSGSKYERGATAKAGANNLPTEEDRPVTSALDDAPKTPLRTPRSAKGKGKAKAKLEDEDDEDDDVEELYWGKNPDVEIYSQEGPLSTLNRAQLKTQKPRSLRPLWLQGVYHPPFFGVPPSDLASSIANEDADSQPADMQDSRSAAKALPWPADGHAPTRLDSSAYALIKRALVSFWNGQVGYVPSQGIYDWGWFPGKPFGWAQSIVRSKWTQEARKSGAPNEVNALGLHPGWPFIQPWLDTQFQNLVTLSSKEALPFLKDTTTPQRSALRHPTTVMKLAVPQLSMRNRLKKSVLSDTPKLLKMTPRSKSGASGGADADPGADDDDDPAAAGAEEDEETIAALDANQEPINLDDPKFADIPNLGFEEKEPICGDVLHVSVGPPDQEILVQIPNGTSKRLDSLGVVPDEGHLLNVGGHVYALDWVPVPVHLNTGKEYFVVSAAASKAPLTMIGQKQVRPAPASLQIWSIAPDTAASTSAANGEKGKGQARLEMVLCHEAGAAFKLAWCPSGHDFADADSNEKQGGAPRRLGLLAGCFADGSLSVFSVPHPEFVRSKQSEKPSEGPLHIRLDPILRLEHPQQAATSLAWAGGELLAFGGSQGWVGVWNTGHILRSPHPSPTPPPQYVVRAHRSAITDSTFILLPPIDANGIARTSAPPTTLFTVSLDGWTAIVDLTRGAATPIERTRAVHYAVAFSAFSGGSLVHENADGSVTHYSMRPEEMLRSRLLSHTPSRVVSLAASTCHPMIAMGTAHGELKVANILRTLRRSPRVHLPVYQQVLNRSTGELVVRHHVQPESATMAENKAWHLAQWHPCLAVTAVRWNPNLGRSRLLLSGTSSGMVKVDFVKPPYEA
ncbi:hypothetical protein EX895_002903 [Sporisorium graminicola]|uniref:Uncharacterized protein n=1 Tax=Sporisorium graminicola TaxID=280036 RepID=A0A4U7KUJ5_9BASI|nr:hypothetical protein EX895_002903 [Sporisorium graminicola]TKY88193.1 hypothetical protein EX895_002903 [Sporisorium graminicola]